MVNTVAKYQKYTEYKKSGVEWLGEIPRHWDSKPLKYLCTYNDEVLPETTAKDAEIQYIDIGSVSAVNGISKIETMIFKDAPSRARRIVRDGDVIVSTVRTYLEAIAPINNPPENLIVSTGFAVIRPNQYLYKSFASYCLRAKGFIKEVVARSVGVSYPAINSSDLVNIAIPSIEYAEQVKIANFLDHETTKIDHLIEKQQQLIELLKEKRQAVISHAVTKGLDPNVPMKDSGVEWLGEVPERWDIVKLSQIAVAFNGDRGANYPSGNDFVDEGIYFISANEVINAKVITETASRITQKKYDELGGLKIKKGDIIYCLRGAGVGKNGICDFDEGTVSSSLMGIRSIKLDPDYLVLLLNSSAELQQRSVLVNGSVSPNLSAENVIGYKFAIPAVDEQIEIKKSIELRVNKIEILLSNAEQAIQLMQERRTALISAAVTGKIDVRNWQAPMVAEADTELSA